jgi:hypothetical protein
MFEGIGARTADDATNPMVGARITCVSCHQIKQVKATGTVLWAASTKTCANCHDNTTIDRLWSIHESLRASLDNIETCIVDLRQTLAKLDAERSAQVRKRLDDIESDLDFLRIGNGIHNIHYASTLTRTLVEELAELCGDLNVAPPQVTLPSPSDVSQATEPPANDPLPLGSRSTTPVVR